MAQRAELAPWQSHLKPKVPCNQAESLAGVQALGSRPVTSSAAAASHLLYGNADSAANPKKRPRVALDKAAYIGNTVTDARAQVGTRDCTLTRVHLYA